MQTGVIFILFVMTINSIRALTPLDFVFLSRKMSTIDPFFWDSEITEPYNFSEELLPTKHDCLLYVYSCTHITQEGPH